MMKYVGKVKARDRRLSDPQICVEHMLQLFDVFLLESDTLIWFIDGLDSKLKCKTIINQTEIITKWVGHSN